MRTTTPSRRGPPLFFDDQRSNFVGSSRQCPPLRPMHVQPKTSNASREETAAFLRTLRPSTRAAARRADIMAWYNPGGGIDPAAVRGAVLRSRPRYVVFDWDQTLTQFDGVDPSMHPRAAAELLMGGPARLRGMQRMFEAMHALKVPYYVLTKNPAAESHPAFFRRVLRAAGGTAPGWIRYSGGDTKLRVLRDQGMCDAGLP